MRKFIALVAYSAIDTQDDSTLDETWHVQRIAGAWNPQGIPQN